MLKMRLKYAILLILIPTLQFTVINKIFGQTKEVIVTETALKKDAIFPIDSVVNYDFELQNTFATPQNGKLSYVIRTPHGKLIAQNVVQVNIPSKSTQTVHLEMPGQKAGFYKVNFMVNLSDYDDTIRRVFGVGINTIKSIYPRPADFNAFWTNAKAELAKVPAQFKITEKPEMAQANFNVYLVEMKSLDNITVRGWLTLPKVIAPTEKLPVYLVLPGYGGNLTPIPGVANFASLALNVRGLGNSKDVINPGRDEFMTYNIQDKNKYILKGVIMDCERMMDYIVSNPALDPKSICVTGGSMGAYLSLVLAGLDQRVALVAADNPTFSDFRWTVGYNAFPMSTIENYAKAKHMSMDLILNNLDYFDLKNFMPAMKAKSIMAIGLLDNFAPPNTELVAYNAIQADKKMFIYSELGHEVDESLGNFKGKWLYTNFHMYDRVTALNKKPGDATNPASLADQGDGDDNKFDSNPVGIKARPGSSGSLFKKDNTIYYDIDLKNNEASAQKGTLTCEVTSKDGAHLSITTIAIKLPALSKQQVRMNLPLQQNGYYIANFVVNTGGFKDTLKRSFGVDVNNLNDAKVTGVHATEDETVSIIEHPAVKEATFKSSVPIYYNLDLKNNFSTQQAGRISCEISTMQDKVLSLTSLAVTLHGKEQKQVRMNIPTQKNGFYKVHFIINTNDYDDTVRRVFGVDVNEIRSPHARPVDFDDFWSNAKQELAKVEPHFKLIEKPELSKGDDQVYLIEMQSVGNLTVRAWLTLPKDRRANQKFPVYLALPGYGADQKPFHNMPDFAAIAVNVRGQGNSNDVLNIGREEFLTYNILDKNKYILRGAIMDCVRAVDFIFSRPEFDSKEIFSNGGSMGGYLSLILASLDKRVTVCSAGNPAFSDWRTLIDDHNEFPMGSIQRYAKENSVSLDKILSNLDYFDLKNFTGAIKCKTLVGIGLLDVLAPPDTEMPAYNAIPGNKKIFIFPNLGHEVGDEYGTFTGKWVYDNFGIF